MNDNKKFQTFFIIWLGQLVSRLGTAVTRFALLIWAYQQSDSATAVALLGFFAFVPMIIVSPFAGVWVDRLDRRKIMLLADAGAGAATLVLLILFTSGQLQLWHLYLLEALAGLFESFQGPAYTALISQLLPKEQYTRASGLRSIADDGGHLIAPFLAGFLMVQTGISSVLLVDLLTLVLAVGSLLLVKNHLPPKRQTAPKKSGRLAALPTLQTSFRHFRQEMKDGFLYIRQRPGLLGLLLIYSSLNFIDSLTWLSLLPVMILARSGGSELALAQVQGTFGAAGIAGGILMTVWGGPKRKIHGALLAPAMSFIFGGVIIAVGRSTAVWMLGAALAMIFVPILVGSKQAIWQSKVAPGIQGRVFALQNTMGQAMIPLGMLLGGLLADSWFEPAMMPGGPLVPLFAPIVGSGPGAGMAVLFLITAFIGCAVSLSGYLFPAVRYVEEELSDQDFILAGSGTPLPAA